MTEDKLTAENDVEWLRGFIWHRGYENGDIGQQDRIRLERIAEALAMSAAQPRYGGEVVERIVEFVQDKLDNGSLSDAWWAQFDKEFRERLEVLAMHSARKVDVEKVARVIEDHFVKRFGATIESDGPSHLVRCLGQTAFNPENLAKAAIEAMGLPLPTSLKDLTQ